MSNAIAPNLASERQPHFYDGQLLNPQALNRLADFVTTRLATYFSYLAGGAIVRGVAAELAVTPMADQPLQLMVQPGVAISRLGLIYQLHAPQIIPLQKYISTTCHDYYLYLVAHETLQALEVDAENPQIQGYNEKSLAAHVVISQQPQTDATYVELCRVRLDATVKQLQPLTADASNAGEKGVIDCRYRQMIAPFYGLLLQDIERQQLQGKLQKALATIEKLYQAFALLTPPNYAIGAYWLQKELQRDAIDTHATRQSLQELVTYLGQLLEEIRLLLGREVSNDDRLPLVEALLTRYQQLPSTSGPTLTAMHAWADFVMDMGATIFSQFDNSALQLKISQAFRQNRQAYQPCSRLIAPAGISFTLVSEVNASNQDAHLHYESAATENLLLHLEYPNGQRQSLPAVAMQGGAVRIDCQNLQAAKTVLVVAQMYKRRESARVEWSFNGHAVHQESLLDSDPANALATYGFIIPAELVNPQNNCLTMTVHEYELNYAFTGVRLYQ